MLAAASTDLFLMGLVGRVADVLLSNFELEEEFFKLLDVHCGLYSDVVHQVFEQAYMNLRIENDRTLARSDFSERLALANLAQQFIASTSETVILDLASECFGINAFSVALIDEDALELHFESEKFQIKVGNTTSLLVQAYIDQSPFSAEENALAAIVDKQLLSRMAASALWVLPLPNGVVVCGAPGPVQEADAYLLAAFTEACVWLAQANAGPQKDMIEVEKVQSRVRELTHEVNNPLAIVQNYLKTLSLRLGTDNSAQADIKTISDEMLRIGNIIQRYAEIGQETDASADPVDLNGAIEDLAGIVRGAEVAIEVTTELESTVPLMPIGLTEFKQIVLNLLKNAAEAMRDQEDGAIHVTSRAQVILNGARYVEVTVADNGPGIPEHIYENLFLANNSSKGQSHSGIGLSVANRLVIEMGGYISCRTGQEGTQFQILLPVMNQLNE